MAAMTTIDIARIWAAALKEDRLLQDWAKRNYQREILLQVGADMRRLPDAKKAPLIVVFPDTQHTGPQKSEGTHELGLVAGINDNEWLEVDGITEMQALVRLNEMCPLIQKAMEKALIRARIKDVTIEYEILQFPFVMALLSITVEQTLPVGGRL